MDGLKRLIRERVGDTDKKENLFGCADKKNRRKETVGERMETREGRETVKESEPKK